jgi:hypothetical protein
MISDFAGGFQPLKHHGMAAAFARQCLAPAGENSYDQSEH